LVSVTASTGRLYCAASVWRKAAHMVALVATGSALVGRVKLPHSALVHTNTATFGACHHTHRHNSGLHTFRYDGIEHSMAFERI
jgi:hypothetical protein